MITEATAETYINVKAAKQPKFTPCWVMAAFPPADSGRSRHCRGPTKFITIPSARLCMSLIPCTNWRAWPPLSPQKCWDSTTPWPRWSFEHPEDDEEDGLQVTMSSVRRENGWMEALNYPFVVEEEKISSMGGLVRCVFKAKEYRTHRMYTWVSVPRCVGSSRFGIWWMLVQW